jgi:threonine dehydrogenase-like Zn-dependent dehydrogenase
MKAVVYSKPFEVVVSDVPIPQILSPNDVIVKVRPSSHTSSYSSSSRV